MVCGTVLGHWSTSQTRMDQVSSYCGSSPSGICLKVVYNIALRQLNLISDNIEDPGSLALTYDSEERVLKLSTKECVRAAVAGGWRRVSMLAETYTYDNVVMPRTFCAPPGPDVTAFGSFASPESLCTSPVADPLVHPPRFNGFTSLTYVATTLWKAELLHCMQKVEVRQSPKTYQARPLPKLSCSQTRAYSLLYRLQYFQ